MTVVQVNAFLTYTAGCEAMLAGAVLFTISLALSPDMAAFPCLPPWIRWIARCCSFGNAWRGTVLCTNAVAPASLDSVHLHLDLPIPWFFHLTLMTSVLIYVLSQKLNPEVRRRLSRRWHRMEVQAKRAQDIGGPALAIIAANGSLNEIEPTLFLPPLKLSPDTIHALHQMPDTGAECLRSPSH